MHCIQSMTKVSPTMEYKMESSKLRVTPMIDRLGAKEI